MNVFDRDPDFGGGGRARDGGSFYHLSFRSGSRAKGSSARGAYDYISRKEPYDDPDRDAAVYTESDHMPEWAEETPADYWDAADVYERANGRLYVSGDFALPRDLPLDDQIELARDFARELTEKEHLPYSLAIHAGRSNDGREHNPHAHLIFSERRNDGFERSRAEWFRRANGEDPARGGAPKSRTFHGPRWVEQARERWATLTNEKLARAGRIERVDHRSYERQGLDRDPGEHYGPAAAHMAGRGDRHDRLDEASGLADKTETLNAIESQIARLEADRATLLRDGLPDDERNPERRGSSHSDPGRTDSDSWER